MAKKYLDYTGLSYFWAQIKSLWVQDVGYDSSTHQITKTKAGTSGNVVAIPYKTSDLTNDSGYITSADVPEGSSASTITPIMDGTASKGTDNGFARGDHVHPTDTSRAASTHTHGRLSNAGYVGVVSGYTATIADGDRLLIADASQTTGQGSGALLQATTITFDGSTTTKALTQKGTWETFVPTTRTVNGKALSSDINIDTSDIAYSSTNETTVQEYIDDMMEAIDNLETGYVSDVKIGNTSIVSDTVATIPTFTGATFSTDGTVGLVPAPQEDEFPDFIYLGADGNWHGFDGGVSRSAQGITLKLTTQDAPSTNMVVWDLTPATTSAMGLMSSSDKTKLDSITMTNGVIDSSVLPSFVDDVVEAYARTNQSELGSTWLATGSASGTVITPETGKIYVLMNNSTSYDINSQFRWGGTAYVKLSDGGVSSITNSEIDTILAS